MRSPKVLIYCGVNECSGFEALAWRFDLCYGFEADPRLAKLAQERFAGDPRVHIVHAALCDRSGAVHFNIHDYAGASSLGRLGERYRGRTGNEIHAVRQITVPAINLHEFLVARNVYYIDLYSSDIQGMDFTVLNTLRPMIERRAIKVITCETERDDHDFEAYDGLPSNRRTMFDRLLGESYRVAKLQDVMPEWVSQDVTWKLRPRYLLEWHLRRSALGAAARAVRAFLRQLPVPGQGVSGSEREIPPVGPARPAIPEADLARFGSIPVDLELILPALRLLTPYRFDIPAKYLYAKDRQRKSTSRFAAQLYAEHLRVWNGLEELEPPKRGIEDYLESFHQTLDSVQTGGFDSNTSVVPVGRTLSPINGSHRIAACLLHERPVHCRVVAVGLETHNYNYLFFRNREAHVRGGLAAVWQDAIALEYCRLKLETYAVLVFPSAQGRQREILDILLSYGHIVYDKEIILRGHGPLNLMRFIYSGEPWLGTEDNGYEGANAKGRSCFAAEGPLRFFVFETYDAPNVVRAKAEIRALFGHGNHSVHINDKHDETLLIAEALLNANSVHFLENARPVALARLIDHLGCLRDWLCGQHLNSEDVCIGGSAVLAAYGLRESKDLDFLHHFTLPASGLPEILGSHNECARLYGMPPDELVYDPRNHFHFGGFKFVSLPAVARVKKARGEEKDHADLMLIRKAL